MVALYSKLGHCQLIYNRLLVCSIGNFFFAGARIFLQSLEAAIFLYSRVCQCPTDSLVLPAICTNDRLTLGSELLVSINNGLINHVNLFLSFQMSTSTRSSFLNCAQAILQVNRVWNAHMTVLLIISDTMILCMQNGTIIKGQNEISHPMNRDTNGVISHAVNKVSTPKSVPPM